MVLLSSRVVAVYLSQNLDGLSPWKSSCVWLVLSVSSRRCVVVERESRVGWMGRSALVFGIATVEGMQEAYDAMLTLSLVAISRRVNGAPAMYSQTPCSHLME